MANTEHEANAAEIMHLIGQLDEVDTCEIVVRQTARA